MRKVIQSEAVPRPATAYSQAIMADGKRTLYISGQVPVGTDGKVVGEGDFRAQVHQVFRNIGAVLEAGGAEWSDVVKLGVYLTDMGNFPIFNEVRQEYLRPDFPAATTIGNVALVRPEWLVEIEAVAVLGEDGVDR